MRNPIAMRDPAVRACEEARVKWATAKIAGYGIPNEEQQIDCLGVMCFEAGFTAGVLYQQAVETKKELGESFYGSCPICGAVCRLRERRPYGNDICVNGHTYPSKDAKEKP